MSNPFKLFSHYSEGDYYDFYFERGDPLVEYRLTWDTVHKDWDATVRFTEIEGGIVADDNMHTDPIPYPSEHLIWALPNEYRFDKVGIA